MARTTQHRHSRHDGRGSTPRRRQRLAALAVAACTIVVTPAIALAQSLYKIDFNAPRVEVTAELAAVPSTQLRQVYLACAQESSQRLLEPGEAVICTMVADTLLARDFNGEFNALIAWWQANRDAPAPIARR